MAYSLYFLGSELQPADFSYVSDPKKITVEGTSKAFAAAFPQALLTARLKELLQDIDYKQICAIRNILAHRLAGGRSIRVESGTNSNGASTYSREESGMFAARTLS